MSSFFTRGDPVPVWHQGPVPPATSRSWSGLAPLCTRLPIPLRSPANRLSTASTTCLQAPSTVIISMEVSLSPSCQAPCGNGPETNLLFHSPEKPLRKPVSKSKVSEMPCSKRSIGIHTSKRPYSKRSIGIHTSKRPCSKRSIGIHTSKRPCSKWSIVIHASQRPYSKRSIGIHTSRRPCSKWNIGINASEFQAGHDEPLPPSSGGDDGGEGLLPKEDRTVDRTVDAPSKPPESCRCRGLALLWFQSPLGGSPCMAPLLPPCMERLFGEDLKLPDGRGACGVEDVEAHLAGLDGREVD